MATKPEHPFQTSYRIQKEAAEEGFDYATSLEIIDKIIEEAHEFKEELANGDIGLAKKELGDLFFSCVSIARRMEWDLDTIMHHANEKFNRRYSAVKSRIDLKNPPSFDKMLDIWNQIKREESNDT